jgi:WhiB family redox-sensing transcriptional regulator
MAAVQSLTVISLPVAEQRPGIPVVDWMDDAECKGHTPLFFPPKAERPQARARREARARALCMRCAVADDCRSFAREHHEYGYWAGESEEERHLAGFTISAPIGVRSRNSA